MWVVREWSCASAAQGRSIPAYRIFDQPCPLSMMLLKHPEANAADAVLSDGEDWYGNKHRESAQAAIIHRRSFLRIRLRVHPLNRSFSVSFFPHSQEVWAMLRVQLCSGCSTGINGWLVPQAAS